MNHSNDSSPSWSSSPPRGSKNGFCLKRKTSSRGVAEIKNSVQKVRLWLGTFDTAEEAAPTSARTNFEFPDATNNLEPFSFEEACRVEEAEEDSFVGALEAKLFGAKTKHYFKSPALHYGSSHCLATRNKNTRVALWQQSLHQLQSPPQPLESSNSTSVTHNQNDSSLGKIHNLISLDINHYRRYQDQDRGQQMGSQWHTEVLPWGSRISYEDSSSTITTKSSLET